MRKLLRAGVVGCGWAGAYHAQAYALHSDVVLVAVCDIRLDQAQEIAQRFHCHAYTDVETMLSKENLDLVSVATPTESHAEMVLRCLQSKIPVLCEKPLTRDVQEARKLVQEAERAVTPLGVNYNRRFAAGYSLANESLREAGGVRYFQAVLAQNVPLAQTEELRAKLPRDFLVFEALSHLLDLTRFLVGEPEELVAYAVSVPADSIWTEISVNLRLKQAGVGTLICSLAGPEWGQLPIERVEIATDRQRIVVDNIAQEVAWYEFCEQIWHTWRPSVFEPVGYGNSLITSVQAWIDAILDKRPPPITGEDGVQAVIYCEQIVRSALAHER